MRESARQIVQRVFDLRFWAAIYTIFFGVVSAQGGQPTVATADYLVDNWLAEDGVPENSALSLAQTEDGFLWIGSNDGLLRFDASEFVKAEQLSDVERIRGVITCLCADRAGRLWVSSDTGIAYHQNGKWRRVNGTNILARSFGNDAQGRVFFGTFDGRIFQIKDDNCVPFKAPEGVTSSGVFCSQDKLDGNLWLANRGFIGRLTSNGWSRIGPAETIPKAMIATASKDGGIWVYFPGELRHYSANGVVTSRAAPNIDGPRSLTEDSAGTIWVCSTSRGLLRLQLPVGESNAVSETTEIAHTPIWCAMEDREGNIWAGGSSGGLHRLKPRQFMALTMADGLPERLVRSVAEVSPGRMAVGTHGGGRATIENGKVVWAYPAGGDRRGLYAWSLLHDDAGRLWTGTFGSGLLVEENGQERVFPLPDNLGRTVNCLMEDDRKRIWFGTESGVGIIENGIARAWNTNTPFSNGGVSCLVEDRKSDALWVGTYGSGLYRFKDGKLGHFGMAEGLRGLRISSLSIDNDGCIWVGVFSHGLVCIENDGRVTAIGRDQGLSSDTIGSVLDDGRGYFWLGSDRGILRVSKDDIHRLAQGHATSVAFNTFNMSDGLGSCYCTEGYQPAAARDSSGKLWFATLNGVVTIDPANLRVNTNLPPIVFERLSFIDDSRKINERPVAANAGLIVPAGSTELRFRFAVLSFSAPEKVKMSYRLQGPGAANNWVEWGTRRVLNFHTLSPGNYTLQVRASNNDGVWNNAGAMLKFKKEPFIWQTIWFRCAVLVVVAGLGSLVAWRIVSMRLQSRIAILERERAFELQRAAERKQAEEEQERLRSQLLQAQKMESIGRLAGGVAHDFNNMLQVILGHSHLALANCQPDSEMRNSLLEIQKSAARSADLTRQLLAFARKQTIKPRVLDLNATIDNTLTMLQRLIGENIALDWVPGPGLWRVLIDPTQMDQLLTNLAVNARDSIGEQGKVTIATSNVTVTAAEAKANSETEPGDYVLVTVTDTGKGMSREVREHLFEPFFSTKENGKGTGLGLATVFGIIKQNHGFITVDSETGKGAIFKVYLPRTNNISTVLENDPQSGNVAPGRETILIVEDEEQILNLGRSFLQRCGYTVLAASSPERALDLAANSNARIKLLITDVVMPGMNGNELKKRLESSQPGLKSLFMSGYTADVIGSHGVLDAGVHFIQKPFTLQMLNQKVRDLLDHSSN